MDTEKFSIWSYNWHPGWIKRNTVPDMLIVYGVSLHEAHEARERIAMLTDKTVEIRNNAGETVVTEEIHDNPGSMPRIAIVSVTGRPERQTEHKPRRKLGNREA